VQLLLAAGFAALSYWAMELADQIFRRLHLLSHAPPLGQDATSIGPLWIASFVKFALTYGFGLALVTGFALYRRMRDAQLRVAALEREASAARLAVLRMQLSPHTLFNLLHTIRGQIEWQPRLARSMVVQLADLLRRLLNAGQRDFSPLADELRFAQLYLKLQQQRFADRIEVGLPDPDAQPNLWVPSLILQPLIENAVVHGLAGHDDPVSIAVEAALVADTLILRVINSTRGTSAASDGIGLRNVRERLAVQFGARAKLRAESINATTWIAEVTMPALREISPQPNEERVA
jgi:sensor histidine kinase YesM